jgi:hypothetical protein
MRKFCRHLPQPNWKASCMIGGATKRISGDFKEGALEVMGTHSVSSTLRIEVAFSRNFFLGGGVF